MPALGLSATAANAELSTLASGYTWVKLHIGHPGANGTSNPAAETTRKQVTWSTPSGGAMENTNSLAWTAVAGTEDYTHYTLWSASTAGTFGHSGLITADAVTAGNNFTVPAGSLDVTYALAAD